MKKEYTANPGNIVEELKRGEPSALEKLYKENFGKILHFVRKNGGTYSDAEDLFQDAMLVIMKKVKQKDFQLTASINTYCYAVCKNLWLKNLESKNREVPVEEIHYFEVPVVNNSSNRKKTLLEKIRGYLLKITDHCKHLIIDMFFKRKTIDQIQKDYGYTTRHNAQNQKYKCVEQIRKAKREEEKKKTA